MKVHPSYFVTWWFVQSEIGVDFTRRMSGPFYTGDMVKMWYRLGNGAIVLV